MQPMTALIAIDGSACAQVALDLAKAIPWPDGSVIHVATVVDSALPTYATTAGGDPIERQGVLIGSIAQDLEQIAAELTAAGRRVETHVLVGRPASAIVDEAHTIGPDIVIVGSRGHGTITSMVLGSVSAEVADHAHCPVLIARRATWSRAILGVDGSLNAEQALQVASRWPIFAGCSFNVASVAKVGLPWTSSLALSGYGGSIDYPRTAQAIATTHARWAERAARVLTASGREAHEAPEGDPASELIRIAREGDADVIIMGTRGQTGLPRLIAGSVARNVMLHAPCSVLVVNEARPLP